MSGWPRFGSPEALILLLLVPATIYVGMKIRSLGPVRKWIAITLRTIILLCIIGALAGAEWVKESDRLAVFFLLDRSNSVPEDAQLAAEETVRRMSSEYMTSKDDAGVIAFGDESSIELSVDSTIELDEVRSFVGGEQTDLAAAIRLAMAAFPQGHMKRIVMFTDGNETRGTALEEIKLASASDVAIDVIPMEIGGRSEVRIREVNVPAQANADEPFSLRVVVSADQASEATLRIYQTLAEGKRLLQAAPVTLQAGENTFELPQELEQAGFYEYEAHIESSADTVMANNEGRSFTVVQGEPTVLLVEAESEYGRYLRPALEREGLNVEAADIGSMPTSLAQFQNYDCVVLSNISSTDLSSVQIQSLEALVRDMGIGLVMVGGPDSFGAGGYFDTPIEKALPVSMDLKQRKIMPRGALALILHTVEIADGNAWSRDIGLAALNVLSSQDLMGLLAYGYDGGDGWIHELRPVGNKHTLRTALNTGGIGDMPAVGPTLKLAYESLEASDAAVKRVVMISDGDPAAPSPSLLRKLKDAKISVSTVCIQPHRPNDQDMLRWIADETGGNFYFVTNPNNLPQIFTKEAAVVKKALFFEKPFTPKRNHDSEVVRGALSADLPTLFGYVVTTPKENATIPLISPEGDPILAHWRYGLGKSVAYTSDATNRWGADWVEWEGFDRFWAQSVRWAVRDLSPSPFRVDTRVEGSTGYVRIDAVNDDGEFVNFLRPGGVVTGPGPDFTRQELDIAQTGPGIYEGTFPVNQGGVYMMTMTYERPDGTQGLIPSGLAMNYSKEYNYNATNHALLENWAAESGGRILTPDANPFEHNLTAASTVTPIWVYLAAIAACLFPVEIFIRRVMIDLYAFWAWLAVRLKRIPGMNNLVRVPGLRPKPVTGSYGSVPARTMVYESSGAMLETDGTVPQEMTTPDSPGAEQEMAAGVAKPAGGSDYTQQLLAAKGRALSKRKQRPDSESEDK
jgi:uncharacterized membrane protein